MADTDKLPVERGTASDAIDLLQRAYDDGFFLKASMVDFQHKRAAKTLLALKKICRENPSDR